MGKPVPVPQEEVERRENKTRSFFRSFFQEEPAEVHHRSATTQSGHQVSRWKDEEWHVIGDCPECGDTLASPGCKTPEEARAQMEKFTPGREHKHNRWGR